MDNNEFRPKETEINLGPIIQTLLSKLWLIFLIGLVFGGAVYGLTKLLLEPYYRSSFTAYINNQHSREDKESLTYSDLSAAQQLTRTYSYMIRSSSILTASAESIDLDLSYTELKNLVSTEIQTDTEIIAVYVTDTDPQRAYLLANAIATTAPRYMSDFVEGSSMKIIDVPVLNTSRFGPSYFKYAIFGFLVGVLLILLILLIRYFRDDKIQSEQEIEERFKIPILGVIPESGQPSGGKAYEYNYRQEGEKR